MTHKLNYLARRNPAIPQKDFGETWKSHSVSQALLVRINFEKIPSG
jgi:hypothetical protein